MYNKKGVAYKGQVSPRGIDLWACSLPTDAMQLEFWMTSMGTQLY